MALGQNRAGNSAKEHFLSHQGSLWVTAPTQGPGMTGSKAHYLPEDSGHLCDPHVHQLARPGGAGVFWDSTDATVGRVASREPARGQRTEDALMAWAGREGQGRRGLRADTRGAEAEGLPEVCLWSGLEASRGRGPDPAGPRWLWGPRCTQPTQEARSPCGAWSSRPCCPPQPQGCRAGWLGGRAGSSRARPRMQRPPDVLMCWVGGLRAPAPRPHSDKGTPLSRPQQWEDWGRCAVSDRTGQTLAPGSGSWLLTGFGTLGTRCISLSPSSLLQPCPPPPLPRCTPPEGRWGRCSAWHPLAVLRPVRLGKEAAFQLHTEGGAPRSPSHLWWSPLPSGLIGVRGGCDWW